MTVAEGPLAIRKYQTEGTTTSKKDHQHILNGDHNNTNNVETTNNTSTRSLVLGGDMAASTSKTASTSNSLATKLLQVFRPIRYCLRPQYSLRTQLLLAFGTMSILSIGFVMTAGIITTMRSSHLVHSQSLNMLQDYYRRRFSEGVIADTMHRKMELFDDSLRIMVEATKD